MESSQGISFDFRDFPTSQSPPKDEKEAVGINRADENSQPVVPPTESAPDEDIKQEKKDLTAAERRELRRQRIVARGENRLKFVTGDVSRLKSPDAVDMEKIREMVAQATAESEEKEKEKDAVVAAQTEEESQNTTIPSKSEESSIVDRSVEATSQFEITPPASSQSGHQPQAMLKLKNKSPHPSKFQIFHIAPRMFACILLALLYITLDMVDSTRSLLTNFWVSWILLEALFALHGYLTKVKGKGGATDTKGSEPHLAERFGSGMQEGNGLMARLPSMIENYMVYIHWIRYGYSQFSQITDDSTLLTFIFGIRYAVMS